MPTYKQYLQATQKLIEQNQNGRLPYFVTILEKKFLASSKVFSPRYFKDTEIFAKNLPVEPGENFCEIGCGIGAISITAAKKGAKKVVAIDINKDATRLTRFNSSLHHVEKTISVRTGDLFQPLKPGEFFGSIFWNTPFGFVKKQKLPMLERSVFDPYYKNTERFIKEGPKFCRRLLIGFSSTLGRLDLLHKYCKDAGLKLRIIYSEQSQEILPVKFEILEAKK